MARLSLSLSLSLSLERERERETLTSCKPGGKENGKYYVVEDSIGTTTRSFPAISR